MLSLRNSHPETVPNPRLGTMFWFGLLALALLFSGCETSPPLPLSTFLPEPKPDTLPLLAMPKAPPTPEEPVSQDTPPNPIVEANNIYFSSGSTRVDSAGEQKLRIHASRLTQDRKTVVTLIGLTDDQGSRSFNLVIAEQRIESVAKILRANGVLRSQIRPYARGNKTPGSACKTAACREKMRRVELDYGKQ